MGPEAAARGDGGGRPLDAGSRFRRAGPGGVDFEPEPGAAIADIPVVPWRTEPARVESTWRMAWVLAMLNRDRLLDAGRENELVTEAREVMQEIMTEGSA